MGRLHRIKVELSTTAQRAQLTFTISSGRIEYLSGCIATEGLITTPKAPQRRRLRLVEARQGWSERGKAVAPGEQLCGPISSEQFGRILDEHLSSAPIISCKQKVVDQPLSITQLAVEASGTLLQERPVWELSTGTPFEERLHHRLDQEEAISIAFNTKGATLQLSQHQLRCGSISEESAELWAQTAQPGVRQQEVAQLGRQWIEEVNR